MKKLCSILLIMLFVSVASAQSGEKEQLSASQIAELQTKKMELYLDLTKEQRQKIYEVNKKNAIARKKQSAARKKLIENDKSLSAEERYAARSKRLNAQKRAKMNKKGAACYGKTSTSCEGKSTTACKGEKGQKNCCAGKLKK